MVRTENMFYAVCKSPLGPLYIVGSNHQIKSILFKNKESEKYHLEKIFSKAETPAIKKTMELLDEYFAAINGNSTKIKSGFSLQAASRGNSIIISSSDISIDADLSICTDKERTVYRKLLQIPFGKTISYKKLSEISGIPDGSRFVGNAMAKNLFPIIIPCHRVIKSDGTRGNYSGGIWIKDYLLEQEQAISG